MNDDIDAFHQPCRHRSPEIVVNMGHAGHRRDAARQSSHGRALLDEMLAQCGPDIAACACDRDNFT
jgi:hypothetical protein